MVKVSLLIAMLLSMRRPLAACNGYCPAPNGSFRRDVARGTVAAQTDRASHYDRPHVAQVRSPFIGDNLGMLGINPKLPLGLQRRELPEHPHLILVRRIGGTTVLHGDPG